MSLIRQLSQSNSSISSGLLKFEDNSDRVKESISLYTINPLSTFSSHGEIFDDSVIVDCVIEDAVTVSHFTSFVENDFISLYLPFHIARYKYEVCGH